MVGSLEDKLGLAIIESGGASVDACSVGGNRVNGIPPHIAAGSGDRGNSRD